MILPVLIRIHTFRSISTRAYQSFVRPGLRNEQILNYYLNFLQSMAVSGRPIPSWITYASHIFVYHAKRGVDTM
jgi:hypothetical protein